MTTPATPLIGSDAPEIDLLVNTNETFRARFEYRVAGELQPLEGWDARMGVGYRKGARVLFTLTTAEGDGLVLEPLDDEDEPMVGVIDIEISAVRAGLLKRNARYDLLLISSEDDTVEADRLFEGAVLVQRGVTALA